MPSMQHARIEKKICIPPVSFAKSVNDSFEHVTCNGSLAAARAYTKATN